jgi:hypothetical protein
MFSVAQIQVEMCHGKNIFDYLQGGMEDLLMGAVPLIPTSVPLSSRKSAEPSGLNSAFSEHLSQ